MKSDGVHLSDIFSQYGEKRGLFSGETKKHQFADAIVFELLQREATADIPVFIYSRDKDFVGVARETENVEYAASWDKLLELLRIDDDVPKAKGLVEGHKRVITKSVSEMFDSVSERWSEWGETFGSEFQTKTWDYIKKVDVEPGVSIKFENQVLVSGKVIIRAQLPPNCPVTYRRRWDVAESLNDIETGDALCKVNVLADMYDDRDGILSGALRLEIETGIGGYMIIRADWPVRGT